MAVVGFIVLFAGVFSAAAAGATRAALLAFILPVSLPGTAADIPARLAGWGMAAVLAVPLAILVWPPRDHDRLRVRAADACAAMSAVAGALGNAPRSGSERRPGRSGAFAAVDRRALRSGDSRVATAVSQHDLPAGRPDHRQSAADAAAGSAGVAAMR